MIQIKNKEIIFPEISYRLTGLFYKIHNKLGRFCTEKQYTDALAISLQEDEIEHKREKYIRLNFGTEKKEIQGIFPDFVIKNIIVIDIKAKKFITKDDYNQMQRYLQLLNLRLGLIVNFRNTYLKPKRIINYLYNSHA